MVELEGKKVIVTGGTKSIGKAICEAMRKAGASLVIVDDDEINGQKICRDLVAKGINSKFIKVDITNAEEVQEMVNTVLQEWGQVDVLVNSAGEAQTGFITELSEKEWDDMINIHLKGTFLTCRYVLPHMLKRGRGKIVNIASVEAKQGFPLAGVHYSAAKGGIMAFTKQLALQVSPLGINVNCVAPGPTDGEVFGLIETEKQDELKSKIPLSRFASPEDIAHAVLFLASPMANYLTGETVDINGGKHFG